MARKGKKYFEMAATFKKEIDRRFKSIKEEDWVIDRNGSPRNGIKYSDAMIQHTLFFN